MTGLVEDSPEQTKPYRLARGMQKYCTSIQSTCFPSLSFSYEPVAELWDEADERQIPVRSRIVPKQPEAREIQTHRRFPTSKPEARILRMSVRLYLPVCL